MKEIFFSMGVLFSSLAFAQVGIDTETPTETLDVNGNTRLRNLPNNETENAISTLPDGTKSPAQDQTFKANRTVVVDANGVVGTVEGVAATTGKEPGKTKAVTSIFKSVKFDSRDYGSGSTERDRVIQETTFTLGCITIYFEPALTGGNRYDGWLYVKMNPESTEGEQCLVEPEVRFGGMLYRTGVQNLAVDYRTKLTPGMDPYHLLTIDYNSEETAFVDFMMPFNGQIFRISITGYAESSLGDENAHIFVGLERKY